MNRDLIIPVLSALTLITGAGLALAGPLDPPAGPVSPVFKTLTEIEPRVAINAVNTPGNSNYAFIINQPGSYYLTGNATIPAGKAGILVAADGVSIDLCGYCIVGGDSGIVGNAASGTLIVRNGQIRGCADDGMFLTTFKRIVIERVSVRACGSVGILAGSRAQIRDCSADENGLFGITTGGWSTVQGCSALSNAHGIQVGGDSEVSDSIACLNTIDGIVTQGYDSRVRGCTASDNPGTGFNVGNFTTISDCVSSSNGGIGLVAGDNSTITRCVASNNGLQGIKTGDYSSVVGCEARSNNAGSYAGIWLTGSNGCAEGNLSVNNGYGIFVTGSNNIIVRNSCRANTTNNFSIPAGNELAPVVTDPGASGFSTMTPWSNVAY